MNPHFSSPIFVFCPNKCWSFVKKRGANGSLLEKDLWQRKQSHFDNKDAPIHLTPALPSGASTTISIFYSININDSCSVSDSHIVMSTWRRLANVNWLEALIFANVDTSGSANQSQLSDKQTAARWLIREIISDLAADSMFRQMENLCSRLADDLIGGILTF